MKMDTNKNDIEELMAGVGSICEIAGLIRDNLIRCGFTREEAIIIVSKIITGMISKRSD